MPSGVYIHKSPSEETKKKMSEAQKKRFENPENHPMFDKHHSEEARKKISKALGGKNHPMYGKHHSEESKRKNSETQKGKKKWTEEDKKRMSKQRKGNKYALGKHWKLSKETRKKMSKSNKGEKSYLWKDGISPINERIRQGIDFRLWRESVFARDNWTCQKCGVRGGRLHPHHIQNFAQWPELRFAIDNGITFCEKCHWEFHKIYGKENNTKEQVEEFLCQ